MGINANPFTWWNGASWGTWFGLIGKTRVGEDALGNAYWQGGKDTNGNPRRWVIYAGANDASRIAPEWFSWLHHQVDDVPERVAAGAARVAEAGGAEPDRDRARLSAAGRAGKGRQARRRDRRLRSLDAATR